MKLHLLLVVFCSATLFTSDACAQKNYIELVVGSSELASINDTSMSLFGGGFVANKFALETGYINYGGDLKLSALCLGGKFFQPFNDKFSANLKLGFATAIDDFDFGTLENENSSIDFEIKTEIYYGIGFNYGFEGNFTLVAEYMSINLSPSSLDTLGIGLAIDF